MTTSIVTAVLNHYIEGSVVKVNASFLLNDVFTDPTTVTLKIKTPAGVTSTYTYPADITKIDIGKYTKNIVANAEGLWYYRWEGTGTVVAVGEHRFDIMPSQF